MKYGKREREELCPQSHTSHDELPFLYSTRIDSIHAQHSRNARSLFVSDDIPPKLFRALPIRACPLHQIL